MEEIRVRSRRSPPRAVCLSDQLLTNQSHRASATDRDDAEHDPAKLQLSPITRRAHLHFLNPDGLHPPVLGSDADRSSGQQGISELLAERPLLDLPKGSLAGLTRRLQDPVLEHSRLKLVKAGLAILKVIKVWKVSIKFTEADGVISSPYVSCCRSSLQSGTRRRRSSSGRSLQLLWET